MLLLVGGYTVDKGPDVPGRARGIAAYDFSQRSGELNFRGFAPAVNPSYLAVDRDRRLVYAVRETTEGAGVTVHRVTRRADRSIEFTPLGDFALAGSDPCHLTLAGDTLIVCSYTSGTVHVLQLAADGTIDRLAQHLSLEGERPAHAHCATHLAANGKVYLCDLGTDQLRVFDRDERGHLTFRPEDTLHFPTGAGPRHLLATPSGRHLIVNCEYRGMVHLIAIGGERPNIVAEAPTLPERVRDRASGAALRLDPKGKYLYTSDRNFDLVTTLRVDEKTQQLGFRDTYPSGGERPREIQLSPEGKWLLAANLKDHRLGVFRVGKRGELQLNRIVTKFPSASSLTWLSV